MPQVIFLRFPESHAAGSSRMFSVVSGMNFGSDVSICTEQDCIDTTFPSFGKMPRIHRSIYDVQSKWSTSKLSTIPTYVRACSYPLHVCRDITPSTKASFLVAILNGAALADLTCDRQYGGRSEMLMRFEPVPCSVSSPR